MANLTTLKFPVFIKIGDEFVEVGEVEIPITVTAGTHRPNSNLRGTGLASTQISVTPKQES